MLEYEQIKQKLLAKSEPLRVLGEALHIAETQDKLAELEQRAQEPDFWNDSEQAQKVQTKAGQYRKKLEGFSQLEERLDEMLLMVELGDEAEDLEMLAELEQTLAQFEQRYEAMRLQTLFTGEYDQNNAILTIHAGAGGTEAQDWAEMLCRMYTRWGEEHDFSLKQLFLLDGDEAGIKSASLLFEGENAYGYLRAEAGVHRLVRISPFDASGRRHTSFASVEVLPELDDEIKIEIRPEDIQMDVFRASGAGGQHVNKTSSAVRLTHKPTGVVVSCQAERSQTQNRETAMHMLKSKLFAMAQAAHMDKIEDLKGVQKEIAWGSQIRSYVFCPYTLVKDHRTDYEQGDVAAVMDGDLDGFINAYLSQGAMREAEDGQA